MSRDPLLPVRLVDGVWTTEGAGSAAVPIEHHPGIMTPMTWPTPAPKATGSADCSLGLSSSEAQFWAAITDEQRTVFAAVALDGSGVWALVPALGDLDPCPVGGEIVDYEANVCSCGRVGGVAQ